MCIRSGLVSTSLTSLSMVIGLDFAVFAFHPSIYPEFIFVFDGLLVDDFWVNGAHFCCQVDCCIASCDEDGAVVVTNKRVS